MGSRSPGIMVHAKMMSMIERMTQKAEEPSSKGPTAIFCVLFSLELIINLLRYFQEQALLCLLF